MTMPAMAPDDSELALILGIVTVFNVNSEDVEFKGEACIGLSKIIAGDALDMPAKAAFVRNRARKYAQVTR